MWFLQWWRRRWAAAPFVPPPVSAVVPSPTRLEVLADLTTVLELIDDYATQLYPDPVATSLIWLDDEGNDMAQPLIITAGMTGALPLRCVGADGRPQNLTGGTATLRLVNQNGTVYANNVSLTLTTAADGVVTWTRLGAQVQDAGDYRYQVKATLADSTVVYFPSAVPDVGNPLTILRAL